LYGPRLSPEQQERGITMRTYKKPAAKKVELGTLLAMVC
jgi:hypothetical protein